MLVVTNASEVRAYTHQNPKDYNPHFNIVLPSTCRSSKWSLPFMFSDQDSVCVSHWNTFLTTRTWFDPTLCSLKMSKSSMVWRWKHRSVKQRNELSVDNLSVSFLDVITVSKYENSGHTFALYRDALWTPGCISAMNNLTYGTCLLSIPNSFSFPFLVHMGWRESMFSEKEKLLRIQIRNRFFCLARNILGNIKTSF
jgi:uncharacterized membrane protein